MQKLYAKELCNNKFFFKNVPVAFECQPTNTGCIALDTGKDAELIAFLDDAISKRKGGISVIDAAAYDAIKKNKTGKVSVAYLPQKRLQVLKVPSPFKSPGKAAEVAAAESRISRASGQRDIDSLPDPETGKPFIPARGRVMNDKIQP